MKRYYKFGIILTIIFISIGIYAQQTNKVMVFNTSPTFTLQINGSYDQGMGQLGGTYNADFQSDQFFYGRNFGATKGYGLNAVSKYSLDAMGHFRFLSSLYFNHMGSYLFGNKTSIADQGNSKFNIFSLGLGIENNFTPNHKMKIYLGLQPLFSIISGSATLSNFHYTYPDHQLVYDPGTYNVNIKPAFRIGGVLSGGMEYLLNKAVGLNFGFNFMYTNLLLKSAKDSGDPNNIYLNDNDDSSIPAYNMAGKRNIVIMNFNAGVCFYWGTSQLTYIIK